MGNPVPWLVLMLALVATLPLDGAATDASTPPCTARLLPSDLGVIITLECIFAVSEFSRSPTDACIGSVETCGLPAVSA